MNLYLKSPPYYCILVAGVFTYGQGTEARGLKHYLRDRAVWRFLRFLLTPWLRLKFRGRFETVREKGPCLVVANHLTDWDPLLLACGFPRHMYFIASEHIFRWGLPSRLLRFLVDPISRLKGGTAVDTAGVILRRLKQGASICLFAEGDRSWTGLTEPMHPTTGRLARMSGVTLITYRLEGGYLASPRWAGSSLRRGRMAGHVAGIYPAATLRAMSAEEVSRLIERDLHEDAWARQREAPVAYRGKNLAEHLERLLCLCPACHELDALHSEGNYLRCSCGLTARFTTYGFLEGDNLPYDNLHDWTRWQDAALAARFDAADGAPLFADSEIALTEILPDHGKRALGTDNLTFHPDRLTWRDMVFPLSAISGISLLSGQTMQLGFGRAHYELTSVQIRCLRKYMTVYEHAKSRTREP